MEAYAGPEGEDGGGVGVGGRITDDMLGMWKLSRVRTRGPSCCAPGCPGCCPGCCPASPPPGSPDSPSPPPPPAPAGEPDGENGEDGEEEGEERVERDDVGLLPCCGFPSNDDTDDEGRPGDGGSHHAPRVAVGRVRRCCCAAAVVAVVIDLPARDSFPERSWRGRIRERTGWERSLPASNKDAPLAFLLPLLPRYRRPAGGLPLLLVWMWVWLRERERGGGVPGLVPSCAPHAASKLAAHVAGEVEASRLSALGAADHVHRHTARAARHDGTPVDRGRARDDHGARSFPSEQASSPTLTLFLFLEKQVIRSFVFGRAHKSPHAPSDRDNNIC